MRTFIANVFYRLYKWATPKPRVKTLLHPEYRSMIRKAFDVFDEDGNKHEFYCFESAADMPTGRYSKWNEFLEDYDRKMTNDELVELFKAMKESLDQNDVEGITNVHMLVKYATQRTQIAMDVDLFMRFMSVTYFLKDENLLTYDFDFGNWKIDLFHSNGIHAFFLKEPVMRWLPLTKLSQTDLVILMKQKENLRQFYKRHFGGTDT